MLHCKNGAEPLVVFTAKVGIWISEVNNTIEPAGALENRGIEAGGVAGRGDYDYAVLRPHAVQTIEQSLQAYCAFLCALTFGVESSVKVFEDHEHRGICGSFFKQVQNIGALLFCVAQVERESPDVRDARPSRGSRQFSHRPANPTTEGRIPALVAEDTFADIAKSDPAAVLYSPSFLTKGRTSSKSKTTARLRIATTSHPSALEATSLTLRSFSVSMKLIYL